MLQLSEFQTDTNYRSFPSEVQLIRGFLCLPISSVRCSNQSENIDAVIFFILNKKNTNHLGNEPVMQWFSSVAMITCDSSSLGTLPQGAHKEYMEGGGEHWLDSTMFVFVFSIKYFIVYIRQTTLHLLNPSHYIFEKQHETKLSSVTRTVCKTMT